jgi:hypothetical protein
MRLVNIRAKRSKASEKILSLIAKGKPRDSVERVLVVYGQEAADIYYEEELGKRKNSSRPH